MGQAIGDFLPSAVGVAISPLPIIAVVLMLVTPRGRLNGPLFVVGWAFGLGIVGTIVLVVADGAGATDDAGATWVDVLFLVLGVLLILIAAKQWRGRPHEGTCRQRPNGGRARQLDPGKGGRSRGHPFGAEPEERAAHDRRRRGDRPDRDLNRPAGGRPRDLRRDRHAGSGGAGGHLLFPRRPPEENLEGLKKWVGRHKTSVQGGAAAGPRG